MKTIGDDESDDGRTPGLGFYFTTSFHFSQISLSSRLGAWFAWMNCSAIAAIIEVSDTWHLLG